MSKRILIAEDEDDLRELMAVWLERRGWEVIAACDGREALYLYHLDLHNNKFFDVLLLDVAMPRLDGFTVGKNIRNLEKFGEGIPRAKHVYVTAYDEQIVKPSTLLDLVQADGYIQKPPDYDKLLTILADKVEEVLPANNGGGA